MAISATDKELLEYVAQLDETQKKSLLELIRSFLKNGAEQVTPQTLEQYNQEIDEALAEVAAGNYISQEELEKQAAKW